MAYLALSSWRWTRLRCLWSPSYSFAVLPEDRRVPYIVAPYSEVIPARPSRSLTLAGNLVEPCKHCDSRFDRVQNAMIVMLRLRCSIEERDIGSAVGGMDWDEELELHT